MQVIPKIVNKKDRWKQRWYVSSYTVSMDENGNFGCSCPHWKFRREECKHIREVKEELFINIYKYALEEGKDEQL